MLTSFSNPTFNERCPELDWRFHWQLALPSNSQTLRYFN